MAGGSDLPRSQRIISVVAGVALVLIVNFVIDADDLGSIVFVALALLVSSIVAAAVITVLHELGHAVAAKLVGCDLFAVVIGHGARRAAFDVGSTRVELRGSLVGGSTIANLSGSRWRDLTVLGAGLAVQAVAIVLAMFWWPDPVWAQCLKWSIVVVSALTLATNLWPVRFDLGPLPGLPTDGSLMREVLASEQQWRETVEQRRLTASAARVVVAVQGGDLAEATTLAHDHLLEHPDDDASAKMYGTLLLLDGRWREAHDRLAALDATRDHELANNTAWAAVMTFDQALLPAADRLSELAFALRPDEPACLSTRGSTLVLTGRHAEGLELLERALQGALSNSQKASVTAFAAIGEAGIGHRERAYELLADAEALHADNPAIAPIRQRVVFAPPDAADRAG